MSIISLAIVTDNSDPKGIGRVRIKPKGMMTGDVERAIDYDLWTEKDPFVANPFLPTNLNFVPELGQTVKLLTYDPENPLINREYISGPFTTTHDFNSQIGTRQVENTSYGNVVKKMKDIFTKDGVYVKEKSEGSIAKKEDYAIYGKYGSDILFTQDGINLRGGKLLSKDAASDKEKVDIVNFPIMSDKMSLLSLKKFGVKQMFEEIEEVIKELPIKKLQYVVEYMVDSVNNPSTIYWFVYEVKDVYGDVFLTSVFNTNTARPISSYSTATKLINLDDTTSTPTFTQSVSSYEECYVTIRNTICRLSNESLSSFDGRLPNKKLHPFYFRPDQGLNDETFLSNIKPDGCTAEIYNGAGLIFDLNEPIPKEKEKKRKVRRLKTLSNRQEQSFGTLSSDKIYFISTETNEVGTKSIPFGKLNKYEYTQEDLLTKIEPNTYATVRGETLLAFIDQLVRVVAGHAHNPTKPMVKNGYPDWDKLMNLYQTLENDILNKSIRIN
jgi:hypothetical protein|tara:strand:- start:221 stop:1711 length:1491 start_codon:yes stop_codon:yes gene_type:complete